MPRKPAAPVSCTVGHLCSFCFPSPHTSLLRNYLALSWLEKKLKIIKYLKKKRICRWSEQKLRAENLSKQNYNACWGNESTSHSCRCAWLGLSAGVSAAGSAAVEGGRRAEGWSRDEQATAGSPGKASRQTGGIRSRSWKARPVGMRGTGCPGQCRRGGPLGWHGVGEGQLHQKTWGWNGPPGKQDSEPPHLRRTLVTGASVDVIGVNLGSSLLAGLIGRALSESNLPIVRVSLPTLY